MGYSEIGNVGCLLQEIPEKRTNVVLEEFIVMPNHLHCIIEIKEAAFCWQHSNQYSKPVSGSVSVIINQYKGSVKKWCNKNGYANFEWQDRFHDRVIRENRELMGDQKLYCQQSCKLAPRLKP